MSIATIAEVNWNNTVDNTNKIGISDTLDNLAVDVWADDNIFVTAYNNVTAKFERVTTGYPTTTSKTDSCPWYLSGAIGYSNINHNSNSVYHRSALIACTDTYLSNYSVWNGGTGSMIRNTNSELRIITSLDIAKNGIDTTLTIDAGSGAVTYNNYTVKETITGSTNNGDFDYNGITYRIVCADIYEKEGDYFVVIAPFYMGCMFDRSNGDGVMGSWAYSAVSGQMYSISPEIFEEDDKRISINSSAYYNINTWNKHELPAIAEDENLKLYASYTHDPWHLTILGNLHYHLLAVSRFGMYFYYNSDKYKPLISQGVVIGYTTDMTIESDIDNWTNTSGHNISPTPPPPPPPGPGYDDDPWSGAAFSGVSVGGIGAFARCYYMTSTELQNLRSWMGSINVPEGFDPMAQIIGLSQVPVALSGDAAENICFVNSSAVYDPGVTTRVVDSGVASQYSMGLPKKYSLGSIDITRRMQERGEPYLDYSCQIELYLPLIGMFSLDTQAVMGRTIEAEAVLDSVSGTLAAYAWVSKDGQKLPIAYGSTTIGVDLPVTAQQYSVAKAALKQANAQLATSLLSSALTMVASASASGKAAAYGNGRATAASGMRNAREGFNSFTNAASIAASQTMVSQTGSVFGSFMDWGRSIRQLSYGNNTAIAGSFGGSTAQWSYPFTPYVKIIRPRFEKPLNYAHTQGVPCVQAKTVGSCTGFIQCVGVDVSGITRATDIERQAIQAALSNGVYAGVGGGE